MKISLGLRFSVPCRYIRLHAQRELQLKCVCLCVYRFPSERERNRAERDAESRVNEGWGAAPEQQHHRQQRCTRTETLTHEHRKAARLGTKDTHRQTENKTKRRDAKSAVLLCHRGLEGYAKREGEGEKAASKENPRDR